MEQYKQDLQLSFIVKPHTQVKMNHIAVFIGIHTVMVSNLNCTIKAFTIKILFFSNSLRHLV